MERPQDLSSIGMIDLLRMSRTIGRTPEKIEDETLGRGLRFEIPSEPTARLEMFLKNSTVRYESKKGKVELEGMSKPHVAAGIITFQSCSTENERSLMISENGEAVVLLGNNFSLLEESVGVPIPNPPKTLTTAVALEEPAKPAL